MIIFPRLLQHIWNLLESSGQMLRVVGRTKKNRQQPREAGHETNGEDVPVGELRAGPPVAPDDGL